MLAISLFLALITGVTSVKILSPVASTNWTSPGPNTISWAQETGDPTTFNIRLAHNNISVFTPTAALPADGLFATGISIDAGELDYIPSCVAGNPRLPTGSGFTLKFLSESEDGSTAVMAVSDEFNITEATATLCSPVTSTAASSAASSTSTAAASSGDLSTSSTGSHLGAILGATLGTLLVLLVASGAALWVYKTRRERRQKTMQFGMKITQRIPQAQAQDV
ncbi:hypothetical protein HWV62_16236 [Athelia sp. TMB]|nr:hypothetical protein HWV62_16236 [Athelia sp. TMB]